MSAFSKVLKIQIQTLSSIKYDLNLSLNRQQQKQTIKTTRNTPICLSQTTLVESTGQYCDSRAFTEILELFSHFILLTFFPSELHHNCSIDLSEALTSTLVHPFPHKLFLSSNPLMPSVFVFCTEYRS